MQSNDGEAEHSMSNREIDRYEQIDRVTSTTICKAIGDRLRQNLVPDPSGLPPRLQYLLDELCSQDTQSRP
jgi:hypothetical protein